MRPKLPLEATKVCPSCGRELPVTSEYFRKYKGSRDGFQARCKDCAQGWLNEHYIHFTEKDVQTRGTLGVKCPLYASICGECNEVRKCWRIEGFSEGDIGLPLSVKKKSKFSFQMRSANED
jgi:hypothetical protein